MRIYAKLIARLLFVAAIPLFVLVTVSYLNVKQTRTQSIAELENSILFQASFRIEKWIRDKMEYLKIKIIDPNIKNFEQITMQQQEIILKGFLEEDRSLEEVAFVDLNGQMKRKFGKGGVEQEVENINFFGTEGFLWALRGKGYLGRVFFENGKPILALVSPVVNPRGEVIAVLIAGVNLASIQDLVREFRIGETGEIYLMDKEENIIAHSQRPDLAGRNFSLSESAKITFKNKPTLVDADRYIGISGEKVIGSVFSISDFGWKIFVEWPEKEALNIVRLISIQTLLFALIVLAGISIIAFLFARSLADPIKEIQKGAEKIGAGSFEHKITIKTKDELEELGNAFNKMTKGLKELSELKDEMVFIAAHELRSPLAVIRGYLSMVLEEGAELDEDVKTNLQRAFQASGRLNSLINEILKVARTEGGRIEIKVSSQNIGEIILEVISELRLKAKEKNLAFVYRAEKSVLKVLADKERLREVLINLMDNGIKYTIKGTITIFHIIKDNYIITGIADTGVGITKEELPRLFGKFFQAKSAKMPGVESTGLGLFITKQLVEKMGGKIWVESEKDKGTTFYFSLPAQKIEIDKIDKVRLCPK